MTLVQTFLARPLVLNHLRSHPPSSRESRVSQALVNQARILTANGDGRYLGSDDLEGRWHYHKRHVFWAYDQVVTLHLCCSDYN